MEDFKILAMVINRPKGMFAGLVQRYLIVNRYPIFRYERKGNLLLAEDYPFYDAYYIKREARAQGFGGRQIKVPMQDGSFIYNNDPDNDPPKWKGQLWGTGHPKASSDTYDLGYGTIEDLIDCYVFYSCTIDKKFVDEWLTHNKPFEGYYEYEKYLKARGRAALYNPYPPKNFTEIL